MSGAREALPVPPRRPPAPASARGTGGFGNKALGPGRAPARTRPVPAWSSPRLSSRSSSSARGGGQSRGWRRCSAPETAAEAAAQEGAALKPMPVHAGLVGSGEGGGAGAVAGPGPWLRHGPGDAPRFLFFLLQARVGDGPPPPPQRAARRGRSESATATATGRSSIAAAGGRGGGREDTKTVSECGVRPRARERPARASVGSAGVERGRGPTGGAPSPGEQRPAARISLRGGPGSINLSPALLPRPPSARQSAPSPPPSSHPIGCELKPPGPSPPLAGP